MTDYQKYINALRKCAKEHENDRTSFGHIRVSDLCRDTANLLEELEQEPFINKPCVSEKPCEHDKNFALDKISAEIEEIETYDGFYIDRAYVLEIIDKYKT
jgi:tRNA(Ser,Leu) C12 N-acetylase TAN1